MGTYLSHPNKLKNISEGTFDNLSYCSAEMQGTLMLKKGWRKTMEDATIH